MQAVISNSLLAKLQPGDKPFEVRDTSLKGFLLRVQPSGVMAYYVEYGRGKRIRLGRADALIPTDARRDAKLVLGDAYHGRDPKSARRQGQAETFADFIDHNYAPWATANIRSAKSTIDRLKKNFPDLQRKKLHEITPWIVEKWRTGRLKSGLRPSTVNRDLDDLKSAMGKAVAWGLLDSHPLSSVRRSRVDSRAAVRFLSKDEEIRLRSA